MKRFSATELVVHTGTAAVLVGGAALFAHFNPNLGAGFVAGAAAIGVTYVVARMWRFIRRARSSGRPSAEIARELATIPHVARLSAEERRRFDEQVTYFLMEHQITGVGYEVDDAIRARVATSAVLLSFALRGYEWDRMREILIYPDTFDEESFRPSEDSDLQGLFQEQGSILFSAADLLEGFSEEDGHNVGIHEFAHLMDFDGGGVYGVPTHLASEATATWNTLVTRQLNEVGHNRRLRQLLDEYAHTDEGEFFASCCEVFFELPDVLQEIAPELYEMLAAMLRQDPLARLPDDERTTFEAYIAAVALEDDGATPLDPPGRARSVRVPAPSLGGFPF